MLYIPQSYVKNLRNFLSGLTKMSTIRVCTVSRMLLFTLSLLSLYNSYIRDNTNPYILDICVTLPDKKVYFK